MKTASVLFGVLTACAASQPAPSFPLCDHEGAPACGNIGQIGRHAATPERTRPPIVKPTEASAKPQVVNVLLGASVHESSATPFARPLVDNREDVTCGNVMSKGGRHRVCRDAGGSVVADEYDGDE